jgi:acyl-coenzyme A synthetase/AMP-(fatty) acid ligase
MEVESAHVSNERVAEAAVIAVPDEDTGQAIVAFVTPEGDEKVAGDLPKTRSGKIMRRMLRDIAQGQRRPGRHIDAPRSPIVEDLQEQVAASKED